MTEALRSAGVGVAVAVRATTATGTASTAVDRHGEKFIIVSAAANAYPAAAAKRSKGVLLAQAETPLSPLADTQIEKQVPGHPVDAVYTTGAGGCFCGVFAAGLDRGLGIEEAARLANAAALCTQRHGDRPSMSGAAEMTTFLDMFNSTTGAERHAA